jgi:hypothetical protein
MGTLGLDVVAGAKLAAAENYGDWYRDPWGWPELFVENIRDLDVEADIVVRGSDGEHHLEEQPFFHLIEVPKSALGLRPAVVQDPLSRLAYLSAACAGLDKLHRNLPDWVYGWRARDGEGVATNRSEWAAYVDALPGKEVTGYGLLTDITSFFASIRPDRLQQIVRTRLGRVAASSVIGDVVLAHDALSTRSGLPQRSFASALLAHAVLQPVDDALAAAALDSRIVAVRRWMDDISAEGDEEALYELLMTLQERTRQVGLELNASKTYLRTASETAMNLRLEGLKEIDVPRILVIAGGVYEEPVVVLDPGVLRELENRIIAKPQSVARPVTRAVLVSLTKTQLFDRRKEWMLAAGSLPHAADAVGRYLRGAADIDGALWEPLGVWFRDFAASAWGRLDWVSSQYALAFPALDLTSEVFGVLRQWLETSWNLQQVAVAVQRICTHEPVLGRNLIRARVDRTSDPLVQRVFALGLLMAGDSQESVRAILIRDPRNKLLLRFLDKRDWKAPTVVQDFDTSSPDGDA